MSKTTKERALDMLSCDIEEACHRHDPYLKRLYKTVDAQQRYGKRLKATLEEVTFLLTDSALGA